MPIRLSPQLLLVLQMIFLAPIVSANDWPQFRGPAGNAASDVATHTPVRWSETENIAWKTALPGRGASSPIVHGERIFVTAYTGYGLSDEKPGEKADLRLHVLCLDRSSGKLLWDKSITGSEHTQTITNRVVDHGFATGTPVTDGENVYAFFGVSGVVAYTWDGDLLWQADVGAGTAGFGSASSPVLFEDLLIVNASIESDTVFAFDKRTGEQAWKIEGIVKAWTSPCIAEAPGSTWEMVINQKDMIYGFEPHTGEKLWECVGIDDYVVPVPISHEGVIYCLGGRRNRCIAIRLGGRGDVTDTHKLWESGVGANVTSPVYYDGHIYWASDKAIANCLDAKTGETKYQERLPTRARVYASIVRAGDKLYLTTRDQGILVLKASPNYEELALNTIDGDDSMFNASPAISNNQLLVRTDAYLYCIGTTSAE
ncbi:MAG: PQQ-binding-like beta-propeller repeat protein [Planctomycetaceae bacterium]|nr:PQQ-binding-like beta-propeller repeat protein [Planctomycetales bacterium]MCB9921157.1 PQQ-binding-like beta-propeller repeat protein [Planctomycetaceae bacterium]